MKGFHNISVTHLHNEIGGLKKDLVEERENSAALRKKNKKLQLVNNELQRQIDEFHRKSTRVRMPKGADETEGYP